MHFNTSRKCLLGGFRKTSDYLAENHKQLAAASNIEISAKDRKESFKNTARADPGFLLGGGALVSCS